MHARGTSKPKEPGPQPMERPSTAVGRGNRPAASPTLRFHRVEEDETLNEIARRLYGDESLWVLLYGANEKTLREAGGLHPGQILYVPFL